MKYNPGIHHRRTIRLRGYDYSSPGAYFVTICVQNRACLFGDIRNGEMDLNDAGRMVTKWYNELENKFPDIQCDAFICMPNHVHFIIITVRADLRVCPENWGEQSNWGEHTGSPQRNGSPQQNGSPQRNGSSQRNGLPQQHGLMGEQSKWGEHTGSPLQKIVQWYKTMTTNEYIRMVKQNGWKPFDGKLWQRNYYEHIVRNEYELNKIREYIINNPFNWRSDENYLE